MKSKVKHGIVYTDNGSPPPNGKIISWKRDSGSAVMLWDSRDKALEMCEIDGWAGYVYSYPDGGRPK